jgi:cell fate regulator YaaT (PSP1 superfamily)
MPAIVGVRFQPGGKIYYFDPGTHEVNTGDGVIVSTPQGNEYAFAAFGRKEVLDDGRREALKPLVRVATEADTASRNHWLARQPEALELTRRLAEELGISVKFTQAEFSFDGSRLTLTYNAPERVETFDLPQRVQEVFGARVETRQIGDRDMARQLGDLGVCGRTLCCKSWLTEFPPVSIKMAKNQDLPLNPQKISGACGRLLCCLAYENDFYSEVRTRVPRYNSDVLTAKGRGVAKQPNILRESINVLLDEGEMIELPLAEVEKV